MLTDEYAKVYYLTEITNDGSSLDAEKLPIDSSEIISVILFKLKLSPSSLRDIRVSFAKSHG